MAHDTEKSARITIGIDLGDKHSHFCVLDANGNILEEGRIANTPDALRQKFESMEPARIALEVGTHSPWISRLLDDCGHEVLVANARKVGRMFRGEQKNDRIDAEKLARVARMDTQLLAPIRHRGKRAQQHLAMLRARDCLVASRTRLVNHIRGALKSFGVRAKRCSTPTFDKKVVEFIPKELKPALMPLVRELSSLTLKIRKFDKAIEKTCKERYPETEILRQVNGVGPLTALCFVLTLEDPGRFQSSRAVGAYLGLRPRQFQSGKSDPELRITKTGDRDLRRLLVGCAQYILGPFGKDSDLRRWGLELAGRGGKNAKKRAVVAVARKLAVLLHRLWTTAEVYEPLRNSEPKRRTPRQCA